MDYLNSPEIQNKIYTELEDLYRKSLFLDAYNLGVAEFGPVRQWPTNKLQLLGARILTQLGLTRLGDAMILALSRNAPDSDDLPLYWLSVLHRRHGPLYALRHYSRIEKHARGDEKSLISLRMHKAQIFSQYRDFSAAEAWLDAVPEDCRDEWYHLHRIDLRFDQDDYEAALRLVDELIASYPDFRAALQKRASILNILQDLDGAISQLRPLWNETQSWWVGRQLFGLYLENKNYPEAEQCLTRLENLPPLDGRDVEQFKKSMRADLLCVQQKYEEALAYLEPRSFFYSRVSESIKRSATTVNKTASRKVLNVPFVRQLHMTCAPASLVAVSRYWGKTVDQQEVIEAICYGGTQSFDERDWSNRQGWHTCEFELRFDCVKNLIDADVPVLLATVEPGSAHLQIIVGYDLSMGTYLLRDPYYPRLQECLMDECEKYYAATGPRCLVLVPEEKKHLLDSMVLPAARLYDKLFNINAALKENNRDQAVEHIAEVAEIDPAHRLRFECERSLAFYDRNEKAILDSTEKLLALFPGDINLQLSKAYSLNHLGSTAESRRYLEQLTDRENTHFLIKSRLVDALRWDHREIDRTEKLYHELLKKSPLHAPTLYGYAGLLWDKSEFRESYQLYRFVTCLEDVNESYAESFFKAARFHKDTELAVLFLKDRFERFGQKSSGPAISLFNALDSLERQQEGVEILLKAVDLRPNDGHLLLYCARRLLHLGQSEKSLKLLQQAKPYVNEVRFNETAAEIHEFQMDHKQAVAALAKVIAMEPLNYNANAVTMRLLTEEGKRHEALEHVGRQLELFPGNAMLQRLQLEWLDSADTARLAECYRNYIKDHPDDTWAHRGLAFTSFQLGDHEGALAAAREAVAISPAECANWGVLGDALLTLEQREESRQAFRQAIRISCDYSYAYEKLLVSSLDIQAQREDLEFIYRELMQQVSYGEGILEFQNLAMRWSGTKKIGEFLAHAHEERPDLWQAWVALAIHYRYIGNLEKSLQILNDAIAKFPLLPRLFLEKAETLRLMYRDDEAIEALEHTLTLSPGWTRASNKLCELLEKKGCLDDAVKLQRLIIKRTPLSPTPHVYLADLLERQGQDEEAISHLERAVEIAPSYHWAWQLLFNLKNKANQSGDAMKKLLHAMETWPENSALLEVYSELEKDNQKVVALLTQFLQSHPRHQDACIKLIQTLVHEGEFDKALDYCSESYWGETRPLPLRANEAWIFARQGNLKLAIETMENIASENENFYDSWRLLASWYETTEDHENTIRVVQHCARLYPNDPNVLVYCAEKLQSANGDEDKIKTMLRHAFELDVTNQHIALTYIDYLIKNNDIATANTALEILSHHRQNPYVLLRQLDVALHQKNNETAAAFFKSIATDPDRDHDMVPYAWKAMARHQQEKAAASVIQSCVDTGADIHPNAGSCLARYLAGKKTKFVEKKLLAMTFSTPFELRYLEGYIRHMIAMKKNFPKKIALKLSDKFKIDTLNWGLAAYVVFNYESVIKANALFADIENRPDVEAWMLYFQSIALRWTGQWHKAAVLVEQARTLPTDDYRDDLNVWHATDSMFQNREFESAPLGQLRYDQLAPITQYALAVCRALLALGQGNFVDSYPSVSPLLRECQNRLQSQSDNPVVRTLKQQTKLRVKKSIPAMNPLKRLFWIWRLSNHF